MINELKTATQYNTHSESERERERERERELQRYRYTGELMTSQCHVTDDVITTCSGAWFSVRQF